MRKKLLHTASLAGKIRRKKVTRGRKTYDGGNLLFGYRLIINMADLLNLLDIRV